MEPKFGAKNLGRAKVHGAELPNKNFVKFPWRQLHNSSPSSLALNLGPEKNFA
jgi:hypothetical protein